MIRPRALREGAAVTLVAPAGPLTPEAVDRAVIRVRDLGWVPDLASHARVRTGYLAGTDDQRVADLQSAIDSTENDAIWCLRGGYGTMRILPRIDFTPLVRRPRPLIGFSDNTALHLALARHELVSFHGPHPGVEDLPAGAGDLLRTLVQSTDALGTLPAWNGAGHRTRLFGGRAEGRLAGGNLALLAATVGTPFELRARDAIVFIEEVGEPVYRVDRMMTQLLLAGVLDGAAGVVVGSFSACPDEGSDVIPDTISVLAERLADLGVPVASGFPFGHIPDNWTLPCGVLARLDADAGTLSLLEPAVAP